MLALALPDLHALSNLGYFTLFLWVFLEQAGLPIPAFPVLIGAGVLAAAGSLSLGLCFLLAVGASLAADLAWYYLGRERGARILNLVCRISWKPDRCITTTTTLFGKYGDKTLLFAKFVPGLGTLAPPLAGMARVSLGRFVAFDLGGCALWAAVPLAMGVLARQLPTPAAVLELLRDHLWLCGAGILFGFVLWRMLWRLFFRLALRRERKAALSAEELRELVARDPEVVVIDVRPPASVHGRPHRLPTARPIAYKDLARRRGEIPVGPLVVVYCDCPADEGAMTALLKLRKLGIAKVRLLRGGIEAWMERGFETVAFDS